LRSTNLQQESQIENFIKETHRGMAIICRGRLSKGFLSLKTKFRVKAKSKGNTWDLQNGKAINILKEKVKGCRSCPDLPHYGYAHMT